jgi:hypothetical protein
MIDSDVNVWLLGTVLDVVSTNKESPFAKDRGTGAL